jgi:hypothetical protein
MRQRFLAFGLPMLAAAVMLPRVARADTVVLLTASQETSGALSDGLALARHSLVSSTERDAAKASVQDGTPDTKDELCGAGKVAGADWALTSQSSRGASPEEARLEVVACRVSSGRMESLARALRGANWSAQVAELLQYLLRPEGVGVEDIQWRVQPAIPTPTTAAPPSTPVAPSSAPAPEAPKPSESYALRNTGLGLGVSVLGAFVRPSQALGSTLGSEVSANFGLSPLVYPIEFIAHVGITVAGPTFLRADAGARYVVQLAPAWYLGPEATGGMWVPFRSDGKVRFLAAAGLFAAYRPAPMVQLELAAETSFAFGGTGTLGFLSGYTRAQYRF